LTEKATGVKVFPFEILSNLNVETLHSMNEGEYNTYSPGCINLSWNDGLPMCYSNYHHIMIAYFLIKDKPRVFSKLNNEMKNNYNLAIILLNIFSKEPDGKNIIWLMESVGDDLKNNPKFILEVYKHNPRIAREYANTRTECCIPILTL